MGSKLKGRRPNLWARGLGLLGLRDREEGIEGRGR